MMFKLFTSAIAVTALSACATSQSADGKMQPPPDAMADMSTSASVEISGSVIGSTGDDIGAWQLIDGPNGVLMEVTIEPGGLTPGWHGLHLHEVGDCSDVGSFKLSGGHMGLIPGGHGVLNPNGPEPGDFSNIWAAADGSAGYEIFAPWVKMTMVDDADGTALIIHQNRDDHITQPIGGAGPRVACAVIKPK
ncbi:MAG: superoxide dismutase family protein [Pseudomonadota bacterium]